MLMAPGTRQFTWMLSLPQAAASERDSDSTAPLEHEYATCAPAPAGGMESGAWRAAAGVSGGGRGQGSH